MKTNASKLQQLSELGQSPWYDNISRETLRNDYLCNLINHGITGLTSNPTIFQKAISSSKIYDEDIIHFARSGSDDKRIFEQLAIADIQSAADLLAGVYDQSLGMDGYVSLEINPHLANDTQGTIDEARRLYREIDRPNALIKVPGTKEGICAVEALISEGISVNVTLIFSTDVYAEVRNAYISGLEKLAIAGKDLAKVFSVASFFVSRVDTAVDEKLREIGDQSGSGLVGRSGIANAKVAYADFKKEFEMERFSQLAYKGAKIQKPLWASTSTKNPDLSDVLYIDNLIGVDSINTMADPTLLAFMDHGSVVDHLTGESEEARNHLKEIARLGINLTEISAILLKDGLQAFSDSYDQLIVDIAEKRNKILV